MNWLLRDGLVYTETGMKQLDVLVENGRITRLSERIEDSHATVLDCAGAWVGPGLVDLHTHLREPGFEWKEDIGTGTEAAAAGGYTLVVAMPNTDPPIDTGHLARFVRDRGRQTGKTEVLSAGCITRNRAGQHLSHYDELWEAGVCLFTDDGDGVSDAGVLRQAMEYVAELGGVIAQHAEDPGLVEGGFMHEGGVSERLGMRGRPAQAEEIMVARDLTLVRMTGVRYHLQHVSSQTTVELVAAAKSAGLSVTAEVTPHHLTFTDQQVVSLHPDFKTHPPLRTEADREALQAGLRAGIIDLVATDHAPHAAHEREVPFEEAPPGVIGLETAVPAVLAAIQPTPELLFDRMSVTPAALIGATEHGQPIAVGNPAHLTVIDPTQTWQPNGFVSRSENSPWLGKNLTGRVKYTFLLGRPSHRCDEPVTRGY